MEAQPPPADADVLETLALDSSHSSLATDPLPRPPSSAYGAATHHEHLVIDDAEEDDDMPPSDRLVVEDCAGNEGSEAAGFERHGLSVAVGSPQDEGKPMPMPHFGQRSSSGSSLSERMQARAGFSVAKLSMPCVTPAAADSAQSPYLTIPPVLSPALLLESPVFLSTAMGQVSPTTGKLLMLGDTNNKKSC